MKHKFSLYFILILCSCQKNNMVFDVEMALDMAKQNKYELAQVLEHYKAPKDSLKYRAAQFLIGNMVTKRYYSGASIDEYYSFIDSVYAIHQKEYDIPYIYDSFRKQAKYYNQLPAVKWDTQTLSADFLIKNIDEAFAVWGRPWNKHLSFGEFCDWILPYRIAEELPEQWRQRYRERFEPLLANDSIKTAVQACRVINDELMRQPIHIALESVLAVSLRPSTLFNIKFGLCSDYAHLAVYAMRACGIPVGIETVPHWGQGLNGHVFNVVYNNDGSFHDFSGAEQQPDEHLVRFRYKIPKVYRQTFGAQSTSPAVLYADEDIPAFFKNVFLQDVTADYPFIGARDITISLQNKDRHRLAYLCVFDPKGWTSVAWGLADGNRASFKAVGPNIVYQPALYSEGKLNLSGYPFLLDTLGNITYFIPQAETMNYTLERKNPESSNLVYLPPLMPGSRFQGADNPEFQNAVTFHTITEKPSFKYITVTNEINKPVKYLRYQSSDKTWGNMAEVEFYAKGESKPLRGKIIGRYDASIYYPRNGAEKLFDGDPLTFFHTNDSLSWGGLELERPAVIEKIRFIIRNDDNGIRKGNVYELFYMDDGEWISLGKQVAAEDDRLLYRNIPKGALYWLRNYTRGREERIFEIRNSEQVVWH